MTYILRNWIILIVTFTVVLAALPAIQDGVSPQLAASLRTIVVLATAGVGAIDGVKRMLGLSSILGSGRGFDRFLAFVQLLASMALALAHFVLS